MICTLAWNTMRQNETCEPIEGGMKGRGDPTSMRHKARGYFEWQHVSFLNRQTWLLIIIHARRLRRLLSLDSTAEIQLLGFWNLWTHFGAENISETGILPHWSPWAWVREALSYGEERRRERGVLLPWLQRGCCQHALMIMFTWHRVRWTFDISLSALNFLTNAGLL